MTNLTNSMIFVPGMNLDNYIQSINSVDILSQEEEEYLAKDLYYNDSIESAQKLVISHLRFVVHIARSYSGYGLQQADLIQEGNIGLIKAVKKFNPERGFRLATFAIHWIRAEIHEFIVKNWRIVKVATTKQQRKLFFNLRSQEKKLNWFSQEEVNHISEKLNVDRDVVHEMEGRMFGKDISFDPLQNDEDDKNSFLPSLYLEDENSNPENKFSDENWSDNATIALHKALEDLDPRSIDILQQRWLNDDDKKVTLQDLAEVYNISTERVRQIESSAMNKLKQKLRSFSQ